MNDRAWADKPLPEYLRYLLIVVDRVGFPILAFLLMFYMCVKTLKDNTAVLSEVALTLHEIQQTLTKH